MTSILSNEPKKQSAKSLLLQYVLFKSLGPTKFHFSHLHDQSRWETYNRALNSLKTTLEGTQEMHVANVGAGWGMLTALAQSHLPQNTTFTNVERMRPVANAVHEFLNGVDKNNKNITVVTNMDEKKCDLVLLDIMSPGLYEPSNTGDLSSGLLSTLGSLKQNTTDNTIFVPRSARVYGCLVNIPPKPCVPALSFPLNNKTCGVHIGTFNHFRQPPQGFDAVPMTAVQHTRLTEPFLIESINFGDVVRGGGKVPFSQAVKGIQCIKKGVCNAMLVWNELDCGNNSVGWSNASFIISTAPSENSIRRQAVILLDKFDIQNALERGEVIDVLLERDAEYGHVTYFECVEEEGGGAEVGGGGSPVKEEKEECNTVSMSTVTIATTTSTTTTTTTTSTTATQKIHSPLQGPRKSPTTVSRWHFSMLLDVDRNSKYQQAIAKAVSKLNKDDLVLDIGTGTGLLSCFAANAGACNVVGCEANAPIARVAYAIVKKNKLTKQVKVVLKHSTDLKIADNEKSDNNNDNDNSMLQKKASLVISEILDCGLLGEQVLPVVKHARKHLMKEGAIALPARARVKGVLVDLTSCGPIALSRPTTIIGPSGNTMNGSVFNKFLRWNTWEQIRLLDMPHVVRLSEPLDMMEIDLRGFEDESSVKQTILNVQCIADGTVSAVVMWFDVDLDEEGEFMITTSPDNLQSCWSQALQLIDGNHDSVSSKQVSAGNSVQVQCSYNDDRIKVDLL
jgi:predicted RNA methylase